MPSDPADLRNTFIKHAALESLPSLIRIQRRLAKKIAPLAKAAEQEKATRADIDLLLVAAGLQVNEGVTCQGYDVTHRSRQGNQFLSRDKLLAAGVDVAVLDAAIDRYDTTYSATVCPMKGSAVRNR